ncbi:GNAT family N-acetyltransferase [Nocardia panacis]|uniref:GNAT family N-acetyltransferase n=1 Tax=Nocardia panacis TaxID=2340916 RepID=A0A3A4KAB0_9NOCA|nr:GNAT family N-acetyltransferase [Nocardia panacis]RJO74955.1 GNAT family N-acetyltransferase [Nocardia panacis]
MTTQWRIESLTPERVLGLSACHIACWREAYRGLVPDHVLDAMDIERGARRWERIRAQYPENIHVAMHGDEVVGFIAAGPATGAGAVTPFELYALYVRSAWYGTGLAHELLAAAVPPDIPCSLWVFADNSRARAFYGKYGFVPDGASRPEPFSPVIEIRMVRGTLGGNRFGERSRT